MSVRRPTAAALTTAIAAGLAVLIPAAPASAAITASTNGTKLIVNLTGQSYLGFACSGGKVAVADGSGDPDVITVAAPALACSALTEVDVTGDSGAQYVYGSDLDVAAFSAKPKLVASLGDGGDGGSETLQADTLDYGPGDDFVGLAPGSAPNVKFDLGAGNFDAVTYTGGSTGEQIALSSTSTSVTYSVKVGATTKTASATNAKRAFAYAGNGNDTFSSTGITAGSTVKTVSFDGRGGNDTFSIGVVASNLDGGAGTNTFHLGTGVDTVYSRTESDVIDAPADAAWDRITDSYGLRLGGRTLTGFANTSSAFDTYASTASNRDVTLRLRPTASGTLETASLNRSGQQLVPSAIELLEVGIGDNGSGVPAHRSLADIVMGPQGSRWFGKGDSTELFDITAPSASVSVETNGNEATIQSGGFQTIVPATSTRLVHAPWADKATSFAHRSTRDLLFRFPSDSERSALATKLANGTTTRAKVVDGIVNSDEYRGLDVDRVFVQFLRRKADAGGRTYWINGLRNGKALWRFRAQLLGSNEYFTKAGATNAAYVTRVYNDVVGRNPDPSGATYWTNKLNNGADRGSVALQFLSSTEARRNVVKDQYLRFLDRFPTTAETDAWIAKLGSTTTGEQDLIRSLTSSSAYNDRN